MSKPRNLINKISRFVGSASRRTFYQSFVFCISEKKPALLVKKFSIYFAHFTKNDKLGLCPQTYHFLAFSSLHKSRNFFQCREIFLLIKKDFQYRFCVIQKIYIKSLVTY